jgi:hypothetical protein
VETNTEERHLDQKTEMSVGRTDAHAALCVHLENGIRLVCADDGDDLQLLPCLQSYRQIKRVQFYTPQLSVECACNRRRILHLRPQRLDGVEATAIGLDVNDGFVGAGNGSADGQWRPRPNCTARQCEVRELWCSLCAQVARVDQQ